MQHFAGLIILIILITAVIWFATGWWWASISRAKQQRNRETEWTHNLNTLRRDRDAYRDQVEVAHGKIRVLENRRADGQSPPRSADEEAATRNKMAQMQNALEQARQKLGDYSEKIEELSAKSISREDALEQLRKKLTNTSRALHERDQKIAKLSGERTTSSSNTSDDTSTIQHLRIELQSEKDSAEQDRQRLDHTLSEHMQTISSLRSELAQRDKALASNKNRQEALDTLRKEMDELKKENHEQYEKIEQLSQGSKVVEHQRARLNALQTDFDDQQKLILELEKALASNEQHTSTIVLQSEQLLDHQQTNDRLTKSHAALEQKLAQTQQDLDEERAGAEARNQANEADIHKALLDEIDDHKITISRLEQKALEREKAFNEELLEMRDTMAAQEHIVAQLRDVLSKPTSSPARPAASRPTTYPARIAQPAPQSGDLFANATPQKSAQDSPSVKLYDQAPAVSDNLKKISGIGPAYERTLNQLGLYTFEQIAQLSEDDIEWVAQELRSFPDRILNGNWVEQAQNLLTQRDRQ